MDLSNLHPTYRKYNNEIEAEKDLAKLSLSTGKKIDVITIYQKGSSIYVWFYFDRTKIGYKKPDEVPVVDETKKKKTKKAN